MKRNISVEMNTFGHLPDITYDYVQDKNLKNFMEDLLKLKILRIKFLIKVIFLMKKKNFGRSS